LSSQSWQCIAFNISATGVGVTLPICLQPGTMLTIHAWGLPDAVPLKAQVVQATSVEFVWFSDCRLLSRLNDAQLQSWRSGSLDCADEFVQ
jgi:hypothetical protein